MIKITLPATLGSILFLFVALSCEMSIAQSNTSGISAPSDSTFDLKNGDRVVFLGNSLFENDLQYNYLETALTTRWPDRNVTFRNIGWTGDRVRGEARGSFTNPPTPYESLLQQLTKTQPTIVFVAYGGTESLEGEAGLPYFIQGLGQLLDTIDHLGAKAILLSPIPLMSHDSSGNITKRNAMLELYASAIAKEAAARGDRFIDILHPIGETSKKINLTDNGIHLNETGYYYLASIIEKNIGLSPLNLSVNINVSKNAVQAEPPARIIDSGKNNTICTFKIDEKELPLPLPENVGEIGNNKKIFRITGLKKGFYTLMSENAQVVTASDKEWKEGVEIRQGATFDQAMKLRELISKKNDVFFHQYRPLNTTYILGFRSYEQGRHVQELEDMDIIIKWLEGQIALNRKPTSNVYQLIKLK